MYKIALQNLEFFSNHGLYPKENLIGNTFIVDIVIMLPDEAIINEDIQSTVNYEQVFNIVKERMSQTSKLLESIVFDIHQSIISLHPKILEVEVQIRKKIVPIDGMQGSALVTYSGKKWQ